MTLDDEICGVKAFKGEGEDEECVACDGYNATCDYYVSRRTLDDTGYQCYIAKSVEQLRKKIVKYAMRRDEKDEHR